MENDPLAPFRRGQQPAPSDQAQHSLAEHEALRLAIAALNEVPNSRVRIEGYASTYQLIPDLEKAYREAEEHIKLEALASKMYDTLLLCEDALTELGRTNDGTPYIQALINIQVIKKEAGYPLPGPDLQQGLEKAAGSLSEEQVIKWMQGTSAQAPAEPGTGAKDDATIALLDATKAAWQRSRAGNEQLKAINAELLEALKSLMDTWECNPDHYAEEIELYGPLIAKAVLEQHSPQPERENNPPAANSPDTTAERDHGFEPGR